MKKKMQDGSRYFRQKDIMRPLGGGILIATLVLVFLIGWFFYLIALITIPASLVMFFVGTARLISDKDMDEQIGATVRDYDKPVTDLANFDRVVLRQPAPLEVSAYSFGEDAKYYKRAKGGTPRSDRYTRTHFFYTSETLMVIGRTLTLSDIGDEGFAYRDFSETFILSEITATLDEHATTVQMTTGGKPTTVRWCELVISSGDGEELLRLSCPNDLQMSELCETVNRRHAAR